MPVRWILSMYVLCDSIKNRRKRSFKIKTSMETETFSLIFTLENLFWLQVEPAGDSLRLLYADNGATERLIKCRYRHQREKPWDHFCSFYNLCFFPYNFHKRATFRSQLWLLTAPFTSSSPSPFSKISSSWRSQIVRFFSFEMERNGQRFSLILPGHSTSLQFHFALDLPTLL